MELGIIARDDGPFRGSTKNPLQQVTTCAPCVSIVQYFLLLHIRVVVVNGGISEEKISVANDYFGGLLSCMREKRKVELTVDATKSPKWPWS